ncbi:hypothetical protein [Corynebacterium sanguinis]|uniref:hypothetical protein n=1 Tax=Corynebacterium sanguinis TaxID=2594913 RepID=UPI0021A7C930|nr:hypothetical protein [Corynebacterium sanguinis]MCT1411640.1 hypothetical protein [Corynebacterium sanguinis]
MAIMMVRGMDYATGEAPSTAHRLGAVESAAPLWFWGALFAGAATIGFCSMAWRWWAGVIAAHALGAGLYAAVGVGIIMDVITRGVRPEHTDWWVFIIPGVSVVGTLVGAARHRQKGISGAVIIVTATAVVFGMLTMQYDGLRNATVLFGVAAVHAALAVGTAQVAARARICRERERGEVWTL